MNVSLTQLPDNLPAPMDDGAAAHLEGVALPNISLPCTAGDVVNLAGLKGRWIIYVYPMTGRPGLALPDGWDSIPGARGCTPQSCAFRDHHSELRELNADVFGLSVQTTDYQNEARERLHLPFHLLSDKDLQLRDALVLPTFTTAGMVLYSRLTMVIDSGTIHKVFYPVFPPDKNADDVLVWLRGQV